MKAKIILTATTDLSYDQRMQRIADTLSNEYEVTLVGRHRRNSIPLKENLTYNTVRLRTGFEKGKSFYFLYNVCLFFYLLFKRADIITATDLDTLPACYWAAKFKGVKLGFDAHEWFTELPELIHRPLIKNIWTKIERWFVPGVDFAYTVNHSIARMYKSRFGKEFSVIRNMPHRIDNQSAGLKENSVDTRILLYQGVLNVGRGLESMIRAMDQIEGVELHLAGEGDLSEDLRKQAATNEFPGRIIFHGYLSPLELKDLTAGAWIGINLLENVSLNYYYSLANKFFDYVQAGIPQITMNFPEYELLNKEEEVAILVNDTSVPAIIKAVSIFSDVLEYKRLQQNCKVAAVDWCWENESKILSRIYQDQLADK